MSDDSEYTPTHVVRCPKGSQFEYHVFFPGRRCVLVYSGDDGPTVGGSTVIRSSYAPTDDAPYTVPQAEWWGEAVRVAQAVLREWSFAAARDAAHDLLAACRLVLATVGESGRCHINEAGLDVVRAAVRKAEGGAP